MTREQYDALIKAFNDAIANIPKPECYEDYTVEIGEKPSKAEWTKWALHRWNNDEAFVPYTWGNNVNPEVDMPTIEENTIDHMQIIDGLKNDIAWLREDNEELNEAIRENNKAHRETHRYLREAKEQITEMQATIDNLRKEWGRTIDLALRYEDKLMEINKQYPGILGDEELKALMTHPE